MISTLLIANRGEIARRVIRTARRMGLATVAVWSDADRDAPHVREADRAVRIGPAEAARSYLDIAALVEAARAGGADAVHPGYGFLSENADFAQACLDAGLVFVGPMPKAIRAMADKGRARRLMVSAGVPVVPGHDGEDETNDRLKAAAALVGYPLLVKAAAGGGGRGMRRVDGPAGIGEALVSARREAESAFGDDRLILEKLVANARHVEVQVFGDTHGNIVHLGERDCSAQRRHQKILEETPSLFLDEARRAALCADAVRAARAVSYVGAGTVEFIVDADHHYFLEMNTRLQVEHPVTEMVAGIDLVEWQLRVAAGEHLPLAQDAIVRSGHAIEARLYAEDPAAGFLPRTGRVLRWRPAPAQGCRVDDAIVEGQEVGGHYDPMLAKFVAHGRDRGEALARMRALIAATPLFGFATNRAFLARLLSSPEFVEDLVTTGLVDGWVRRGHQALAAPEPGDEDFALAAAILALAPGGDWFRSTGVAECPVTLACGDRSCEVVLRFERGALHAVTVDGNPTALAEVRLDGDSALHRRAGADMKATWLIDGRDLWLDVEGTTFRFTEPDPLTARRDDRDPSLVVSPVAGLVRAVHVAPGDVVEAGQAVAVIEAMKMETVLRANMAGRVEAVEAKPGEQARVGAVVVRLSAPER